MTSRQLAIGGGLLGAAFAWSYWPVLQSLKSAWDLNPDYSHGYLVVPMACCLLWARRDTCPGLSNRFAFGGLVLLALGVALRALGCLWYIDPFEGWSLLLWAAGLTWTLGGLALVKWSWPAIAFLVFMVPLPYRAEVLLSGSLQRVATSLSCWCLQLLGQGAIAEGNIVVLDETKLLVAEACSGLRIFVSVAALAFAFVVLVKKPWWTRLILALSVLPVALVSNAVRIVATGLLQKYVSGEWAHRFSHDLAGWLMIPFAAAAMGAVIWYVDRLFVETEAANPHTFIMSDAKSAKT